MAQLEDMFKGPKHVRKKKKRKYGIKRGLAKMRYTNIQYGTCENCGKKGQIHYLYGENFWLGKCKYCGGNVL